MLKQQHILPVQKEPDALSRCLQMQLAYGNPLFIFEADEGYNDLNRKLIIAYRERHGAAYLGSVNYYNSQRQRIAAGAESIYEAYTGQPLYNFCCSFCVPTPDPMLEDLIRRWNREDTAGHDVQVDEIMNRIHELDGLNFIWF